MTDGIYAGDVMPKQAWDMLSRDRSVVLVDCRTTAEWKYVGIPDLSALDMSPLFVEWKTFPDNNRNDAFADDVASQITDTDTTLLFLCRSGQRSKSAAIALTAAGYGNCYNIATGFQGDKDAAKHRGTVNGWQVEGLSWVQG